MFVEIELTTAAAEVATATAAEAASATTPEVATATAAKVIAAATKVGMTGVTEATRVTATA